VTRAPELEKAIEDRCCAKIEARGGLCLKLVLLGIMGWFDRTILLPNRVIFFCEFKRRKLGKVSVQQATWRRIVTLLGFGVYTIDTDEQFEIALARELSRGLT
jgi:hypothetical protein